jgi:acyl-CoA thioester hydrolase
MERAGTKLAVADVNARFHGAARYEELIRVQTTLADIQSRFIVFDYVITNAESGQRLVTARTSLVSIDSAGKPRSLPAEIRALFE